MKRGRTYFRVRRKKEEEEEDEEEEKTGRMSFQLEPSESLISYPICSTEEALVSGPPRDEKKGSVIDLFTDTVAILNLLDVRSIMGCPGGTRSVFTRAFGAKENFTVYFSGKDDHYFIQTRRNDLFSHYNLFLRKLKEKLARKARVNTERVYQIVLMSPGNESQYGRRIGKKVYWSWPLTSMVLVCGH